jgi:ABC-type glycerol-3-phosphate transport system permease component
MLPVLLFVWLVQRQMLRGAAAEGVKG